MNEPVVPARDIVSVSALVRQARGLLEMNLPMLWVEGEISNLARPASGHLYFTLKDEFAQVRCAMFRTRALLLREAPANGRQVLVRARVTLYEARGEFQLVVESLEPAGEGRLRRAFEALRARLEGEGLFDAAHKRAIPRLAQRIGVLTSPAGAALRDVLTTLARRAPQIPVIVYPVPVQGDGAAAKIIAMLKTAAARAECDVLLLVRGGGSLEDLQAFNDEALARAVRACPIPVIAGIGHETDVSITDLVADLRAATPTAAAVAASPDTVDWRERAARLTLRLHGALQRRRQRLAQLLQSLHARLNRQQPRRRLEAHAQRLDELDGRLRRALAAHLRQRRQRQAQLLTRLAAQSPRRRLAEQRRRLKAAQGRLEPAALRRRLQGLAGHHEALVRRLAAAMRHRLAVQQARYAALLRELHALSPLATLARGYAIVRDAEGRALRHAGDVAEGSRITAQLAHGRLHCRVEPAGDDEAGL
ncbi:exodeoxyribonuclease VII large subunit [Plasticicumulans sp.]|uniref:exodeoxyribonuclease VII large subunit n=1 Tax=Plasticicumulans sp. TaxID=2307179 RepID=UPI00394EB656